MGRSNFGFRRLGGFRGLCIRCKAPFVGKGDRCPSCADDLPPAPTQATIGDWCPGVPGLRPARPAASLQADHVVEVAAGGPESGPLVVRCGPCNNAKAARVLSRALAHDPRPAELAITLTSGDGGNPGPVVVV